MCAHLKCLMLCQRRLLTGQHCQGADLGPRAATSCGRLATPLPCPARPIPGSLRPTAGCGCRCWRRGPGLRLPRATPSSSISCCAAAMVRRLYLLLIDRTALAHSSTALPRAVLRRQPQRQPVIVLGSVGAAAAARRLRLGPLPPSPPAGLLRALSLKRVALCRSGWLFVEAPVVVLQQVFCTADGVQSHPPNPKSPTQPLQ